MRHKGQEWSRQSCGLPASRTVMLEPRPTVASAVPLLNDRGENVRPPAQQSSVMGEATAFRAAVPAVPAFPVGDHHLLSSAGEVSAAATAVQTAAVHAASAVLTAPEGAAQSTQASPRWRLSSGSRARTSTAVHTANASMVAVAARPGGSHRRVRRRALARGRGHQHRRQFDELNAPRDVHGQLPRF